MTRCLPRKRLWNCRVAHCVVLKPISSEPCRSSNSLIAKRVNESKYSIRIDGEAIAGSIRSMRR